MGSWVLKTEPDCYSWDDLVRDRRATWDGVANALALKHIRTMKKGDLALIYHTGDQRTALGIAQITSNPYADPKEADDRLVVVDLKPKRKLSRGITISDLRADPAFAGWDFLRISRLSVVPVPEKMWRRIIQLAEENP
ncbi:MAG: EVE domain-containing protein [Tepidisphaeraceae bacterium]|jgi:predicted RNA-binding protein with PUA-like domain